MYSSELFGCTFESFTRFSFIHLLILCFNFLLYFYLNDILVCVINSSAMISLQSTTTFPTRLTKHIQKTFRWHIWKLSCALTTIGSVQKSSVLHWKVFSSLGSIWFHECPWWNIAYCCHLLVNVCTWRLRWSSPGHWHLNAFICLRGKYSAGPTVLILLFLLYNSKMFTYLHSSNCFHNKGVYTDWK